MKKEEYILEKQEYVLKELEDGTKITVRQLQLAMLDIMDELHRVCVNNKINYGLIAGAALGIYNYGGFVPWHDNMTVCVKREDWNRLIKGLKKDLPDKYYFQCFETDKKYNALIPSMKIRKKGTYIQEVNYLLENRCPGDGIFINVVMCDNIANNKLIEELCRLPFKLFVPGLIFLDNLGVNAVFLKKIYLNLANKLSDVFKNSRLTSHTIAIPWFKFLKEPVLLKKDVYPFKLYDFEGRKFYSYNNIEKALKSYYGKECLKVNNGNNWIEPLPIKKRIPGHIANVNLECDLPSVIKKNKGSNFIKGITIGFCLSLLAFFLFNEFSFPLIGIGIMLAGISTIIYLDR